jgi:1,4-dihydroxy-2-naphthoate polyprenyltransferase
VRLGRDRTRVLYAAMVLVAFAAVPVVWLAGSLRAWVLLSWLVLPIALRLIKTVREHADGPTLNRALAGTALMELLFCVLLSAGILLS